MLLSFCLKNNLSKKAKSYELKKNYLQRDFVDKHYFTDKSKTRFQQKNVKNEFYNFFKIFESIPAAGIFSLLQILINSSLNFLSILPSIYVSKSLNLVKSPFI